MSRILPRYQRTTIAQDDMRKIDKIIGESTADETTTNTRATAPGDSRKLRGIPVAGGACGTSPGTNPLAETIRRMMGTNT